MTKKLISLMLCVLFCVMSATFVSAASVTNYVVDDLAYLYPDEITTLNYEAAAVLDECGVGAFVVYTMSEELYTYDVNSIVNGLNDYVVMLENDTSWYMCLGGRAANVVTENVKQSLRDRYDEADTYFAGVSAFFAEVANVFAKTTGSDETVGAVIEIDDTLLYDGADLLTDTEEIALLERLNSVSATYKVDVIVATVDTIGNYSADDYVAYYYDQNGCGYGDSHDGVLLLISMEERQYRILSNGFGADAVSDDDIDNMDSLIASSLSDGNYADAFHDFVDECEYQINGEINGFPFNYGKSLLIALAIGFVIAFIVTGNMKAQLKSVHKQLTATEYTKQGSLQIVNSNDFFLYRTVDRRQREKDSGKSGGSSSRNVGGGSF